MTALPSAIVLPSDRPMISNYSLKLNKIALKMNGALKKVTRGRGPANGQTTFEQHWRGNANFDNRKLANQSRKRKFSQAMLHFRKKAHPNATQHCCCCQRIQLHLLSNRLQLSPTIIGAHDARQFARRQQQQQQKNAKLRQAFGISEYFIEGSSLDPRRFLLEAKARNDAQTNNDIVEILCSKANLSEPTIERKLIKETTLSTKKKKMKKHKKDRSESPKSKRKKDKSKKKKKDKKIKKSEVSSSDSSNGQFDDNSDSVDIRPKRKKRKRRKCSESEVQKKYENKVHLAKRSVSSDRSHCISEKGKKNSIKANDCPDKKNDSKEIDDVFTNNSIKEKKMTDVNLALTLEKDYSPGKSGDKEHLTKDSDKLKRTRKDHERTPTGPKEDDETQEQITGKRKHSIGSRSSRSRSRSVEESHKWKNSTNKKRSTGRRSGSRENWSPSVSIKRPSSENKEEASVNDETASSKLDRRSNEKEARVKARAKRSSSSFSPSQRQERYTDILHEVKKILKRDAIGKRKLKQILKRHRSLTAGPSVKLRSSSEDDTSIPEIEQNSKFEEEERQLELIDLKHLQTGLAAKARENLGRKCQANLLENTTGTFPSNPLGPAILLSSLNTIGQANIQSRTPSPALPLLRDEGALSNRLEPSRFDQPIRNNNNNNNNGNHPIEPAPTVRTNDAFVGLTGLINHTTGNSSTLDQNKKEVQCKRSFGFHRSYSRSVTPSRSSTGRGRSSSLPSEEDIRSNKAEEENLVSVRSSPSKTSSASGSPLPSRLPLGTRSRSGSFSKRSRSMSRSLSRNSRDPLNRSCSKASTRTFLSSPRRSAGSYSCSSRSSSSHSHRSSRGGSSDSSRSRSPSIPRRHGSPSFLDRRRITSARKRPVPYHRPTPSPLSSPSSVGSSSCSSWSGQSHRSAQTPNYSSPYLLG